MSGSVPLSSLTGHTSAGQLLTKADGDALYATTGHNHNGVYQPANANLSSLAGLTFAGNGGLVVRVNSGGTGLELVAGAGGGTWGSITGTLASQTDLANALAAKEPTITAGTTAQYYRGDKTWQTLNAAAVGLNNVTNTVQQPLDASLTSISGLSGTSGLLRKSGAGTYTLDTNTYATTSQLATVMTGANGTTGGTQGLVPAPAATDNTKFLKGNGTWATVSAGTWGSITGTLSSQTDLNTALSGKEPTIGTGTVGQYWRGDKTWQTLNSAAVGLGNVDNTSDVNKPISTATQTALNAKAVLSGGNTFTGNQVITGTLNVVNNGSADVTFRDSGGGDFNLNFLNSTGSTTQVSLINSGGTFYNQATNNHVFTNIGNTVNRLVLTDTTATFPGTVSATNVSGTNTGDETTATIKTKLGITTLSGSNTGDETSSTILTKLSGASGGGTTNYLRADGTWAAPAGGGGSLSSQANNTLFGNVSGATAVPGALTGTQATAVLDAYVGATATVAGTKGLVPAATTAQRGMFLKGDGTWATNLVATWGSINGTLSNQTDLQTALNNKLDTTHAGTGGSAHATVVAGGAAGFMTGADKTKLNAITGTNTGDETKTSVDTLLGVDGTTTTLYYRKDGTWAAPSGGSSGMAWAPVTATGTGASQNITIPESGLTVDDIEVFINGILQAPTTNYTLSGTTVTLTTDASGDYIRILKPAGGTVSGGGGGGTWGSITGTLSSQTDLQTALNAKAALAGATFTGAISATNLSGTNTGDQDLSGLQPKATQLTNFAAAAWSAGTQVVTLTAANTITLKTVGSASGNILDKASGDALYAPISGSANYAPSSGSANYQAASSQLTAVAGAAWSAGTQVLTLTAANTVTLKTVGSATGNLLDKAAGDSLYQPVGTYATGTGTASGTNTGDETYSTITTKLAGGSGGGTTNFLRADGTFAAPPSGGSPAWGSITGTLSSQTDLNTALSGKAPTATPTFTGNLTTISGGSGTNVLKLVTSDTSTNSIQFYYSATTLGGSISVTNTNMTVGAAGANNLNLNASGSGGSGINFQNGGTTYGSLDSAGWHFGADAAFGTNNIASVGNITASGNIAAANKINGWPYAVTGKTLASERYPLGIAQYAITVSGTNSVAKALVAATASTVFTIKKGTVASPTTIGTFTFAASGTTATVSITAGSVSSGDFVWIEAPATPDTTLQDIAFVVRS